MNENEWIMQQKELTRLRADLASARAECARLREEVKEVIRVLILCDNPDTISAARALEQALSTTPAPSMFQEAITSLQGKGLIATTASVVPPSSEHLMELETVVNSHNELLADAEALAGALDRIAAWPSAHTHRIASDALDAYRARHPAPAKDKT